MPFASSSAYNYYFLGSGSPVQGSIIYLSGLNGSSFRLGTGTTTNLSSYTMIDGRWKSLALGEVHGIGVKGDGTLWCWGQNNYGQRGDIEADRSYIFITTGFQANFAIASDYSLWTWGISTNGVLGLNSLSSRSSPTQVGSDSWIYVTTSYSNHSFGIKSDNTLWGWGTNTAGQLGDGTTVLKRSPIQLSGLWSKVVCSNSNTYAIKLDGTLWAWGLGTDGAIGDGAAISRSSPVQIGSGTWLDVTGLLELSANGGRAIRASDRSLWCWGTGIYIGQNSSVNRSSPVQVGVQSWTMINFGKGITTTNKLWVISTGNANGAGTMDGSTIARSSPSQIGTADWSSISGFNPSFGKRTDGTWWVAGGNIWGVYFDGNSGTISRSSMVQLGTLAGSNWRYIVSSVGGSTAAIGLNELGQLWFNGSGTYYSGMNNTISRSSPVQISSTTYKIRSLPVQIGSATNWVSVYTGTSISYAINSNGELYGWGDNTYGKLGVGDNLDRSGPTQITAAGVTSWSQVSVGENRFALFLASNGTLWGAGYNQFGELGIGVTGYRSSPSQISGTWTNFTAYGFGGLGIKSNGSLWSWGRNIYGELGLNIPQTRSSPTQVGTSSWTQVSAGPCHVMAIRSDNTLWGWGDNTYGQLAIGTWSSASFRSSPVQVSGSWNAVYAGGGGGVYEVNVPISAMRNAGTGTWFVAGHNAYNALGQAGGGHVGRSSPTQITAVAPNVVRPFNGSLVLFM